MKTTLTAGIAAKRKFRIDRERTIDFMGEQARVYATPMLVRDIEAICRGKHMRFVVDLKQTEARLAAKAKKAKGA